MGTMQNFIVGALIGAGTVSIVKAFQLPPTAACVVGMGAILLNNYLTGRK